MYNEINYTRYLKSISQWYTSFLLKIPNSNKTFATDQIYFNSSCFKPRNRLNPNFRQKFRSNKLKHIPQVRWVRNVLHRTTNDTILSAKSFFDSKHIIHSFKIQKNLHNDTAEKLVLLKLEDFLVIRIHFVILHFNLTAVEDFLLTLLRMKIIRYFCR